MKDRTINYSGTHKTFELDDEGKKVKNEAGEFIVTNEEKYKGEVIVAVPENLDEAAEQYGSDPVFGSFMASYVIDLQGVARANWDDNPQKACEEFTPGQKAVRGGGIGVTKILAALKENPDMKAKIIAMMTAQESEVEAPAPAE